ncbi:GntR family transcriptional regulator [Actinomadura logoneensis]|uniref:GntR family transcriptional regulator n=1 Tax=Actinomadura logoneensis TaxID=2293572 RepID=A0A372JSW5_9ACTN|nr:GntR family transcriptional regulator [Actinomadura logoneensis]RFU42854.1 GntR family transcriptional regulator [Actinomadura logoneensis]
MAGARYRDIADDLARRIEEGEFAAGERLPTEEQLMVDYDNASRNTIREAVKILKARGLVETTQGRGTFVLEGTVPFAVTLAGIPQPPAGTPGGEGAAYRFDAELQARQFENKDPKVEIQRATPEVAKALALKDGTRVVLRHQERFIEGRAWSLQTTYYPMEYVTRGADRLLDDEDIDEGAVAYLKETLGVEQVAYRDRITARAPDSNETTFFSLRDSGSVVIVHDRVGYDVDQRPIRFTRTVYPADRNQLDLVVGVVPPSPWAYDKGAAKEGGRS